MYPPPVFYDKKREKIDFSFVLCSLIRTFALDHRHACFRGNAGVTFVGKNITAFAIISRSAKSVGNLLGIKNATR